MTTERELAEIKQRLGELRADLRDSDRQHLERYHSLKSDVGAVGMLVDAAKRADAALAEHDDRLTGVERVCGNTSEAQKRADKRLEKLEGMNISVLAAQVQDLRGQVRWLIVTFVGFILTILIGIIVFLVNQRAIG